MRTSALQGAVALIFQLAVVSGCENTTSIELLPDMATVSTPPDMTRLPEVLLDVPHDANGQTTTPGSVISVGEQRWFPYATEFTNDLQTVCPWTFTECDAGYPSKGFFLKLPAGSPKITCRIGVMFFNSNEEHRLKMDATYSMRAPASPKCGSLSCLKASVDLSMGFANGDTLVMNQEWQAGSGAQTIKAAPTMVSVDTVPAGVPLLLSLSVSIDMPNEADPASVCFQSIQVARAQ